MNPDAPAPQSVPPVNDPVPGPGGRESKASPREDDAAEPPGQPHALERPGNEELVRRHIDLSWNDADFDGLDRVWDADAVIHLPTGRTLTGLEELKDHLRSVVLGFTERRCEIDQLVCEDDTVANRWTFRGTAAGQRMTIRGMDFYRVSGGRIVEEWIALGKPETTAT